MIRPRIGFSHRHRGEGQHQGSDRGTPRRGAPAHPGPDRAARRRAAQPRLLAAAQPARLGPRPHRQLRGALAGADDRRPRAAARRPRPLLRRDREPAQDPRRAADPARRRAARLPRRRPRAHPRGPRRDRDRRRRRGSAAARRLRLRDAARARAPAQRDDAAAAADGRRLRAARADDLGPPAEPRRGGPRRSPSRPASTRSAPARAASPTTTSAPATRSSSPPSRSTAPRSTTPPTRASSRRPAPSRRCTGGATARTGCAPRWDAPSPSTGPAGHPRLLARGRGLRPLGGQAAADRAGVGGGRGRASSGVGARLGVDLLRLPRLPRLRGVPLSGVLGGLLRRRAQGAARRLLGDPPERDAAELPQLGPAAAPPDLLRHPLREGR